MRTSIYYVELIPSGEKGKLNCFMHEFFTNNLEFILNYNWSSTEFQSYLATVKWTLSPVRRLFRIFFLSQGVPLCAYLDL